jgi:hypothetical protein
VSAEREEQIRRAFVPDGEAQPGADAAAPRPKRLSTAERERQRKRAVAARSGGRASPTIEDE